MPYEQPSINEVHSPHPFFKELENENKEIDPYHWHKVDFLKVTPEESVDMSFPDPFMPSIPPLPPPNLPQQQMLLLKNQDKIKHGIMINEKGSSGERLQYKYSLLSDTNVESHPNSVTTTTTVTTTTVTTTTFTTPTTTTTTTYSPRPTIPPYAEKKTSAIFRRRKPVIKRKPIKMYSRPKKLMSRPKIRLEDEEFIPEFKSASISDMVLSKEDYNDINNDFTDINMFDDNEMSNDKDMLTDNRNGKTINKRKTILNHLKFLKPTYKFVSDSKPKYKVKPNQYIPSYAKPQDNHVYNDVDIEPPLSVENPFGQVPYKFEEFMPIPMLSPFPFMSKEFLDTVSKKIPNNSPGGLIENWGRSFPDQLYYPKNLQARPTYEPTIKPAYRSSLMPSYRTVSTVSPAVYPTESHKTVLPPVYTTPKDLPYKPDYEEYHAPEFNSIPIHHEYTSHNDDDHIDDFFSAPFPQSEYNALQFPIPYIKKPVYNDYQHTMTVKPQERPKYKYSTQVELPPSKKKPKYLPHNKIIKATFFEDMEDYDEMNDDIKAEDYQVRLDASYNLFKSFNQIFMIKFIFDLYCLKWQNYSKVYLRVLFFLPK